MAPSTARMRRSGTTGGNCWQIASARALGGGTTIDVLARPRAVINGKPSDSNTAPADDVLNDSLEAICDNNRYNGIRFTFFLLLTQATDVVDSTTWEETTVDTVAPPAPSNIEVTPGDELLFISWDIDSEAEDTDTQGYSFFCDTGTVVENAGGAGGMGGSSSSCETDGLELGERYEVTSPFFCGASTNRSARNGQTDPEQYFTQNGTTYAVGVSATDQVFNQSRVESVSCGTPEPVITFFESYRDAGGRGGGGCAVSPLNPVSLVTAGLWGMGGFLMLGRRRRLWAKSLKRVLGRLVGAVGKGEQ